MVLLNALYEAKKRSRTGWLQAILRQFRFLGNIYKDISGTISDKPVQSVPVYPFSVALRRMNRGMTVLTE